MARLEQRGAYVKDKLRQVARQRGAHRETLLAYWAAGTSRASAAMLLFIVPLRASELHWSLSIVGLEIGAVFAGPLVLAMPLGRMVDRCGTRKVVLCGAMLGGAAASACSLTTSQGYLAVLLAAVGLGESALWIAAQATIGRQRQGSFGVLSAAAQGGNVVGPVLSGLIAASAGDRVVFLAVGGSLGMAALLAVTIGVPKPASDQGTPERSMILRQAGRLLRQREIALLLGATVLRVGLVVTRGSFYPLFLHAQGFSKSTTGLIVGVVALIGVVVAPMSDKLRRVLPGRRRLFAGLVGASAAIGLAPTMPWLGPQLAIATVLGLCLGISQPTLLAEFNLLLPGQARGLAVGLRTTIARASQLTVPIGVGMLASVFSVPTALMAIGSTGILLSGAFLIGTQVSPGRTPDPCCAATPTSPA